ncbi:MAG: hypothetical protein LBH00_10710 [Planctomycetaceae bacterium]|jgi:alpha-mannosidase|nr:hypothetical protein [Planctomycetaceae bacterium]
MSVIVLYPCSQFDYLLQDRTEEEAQQLFEYWTAAHHPAVLEINDQLPRWETVSVPLFNLQNDTVLIPPCCESFWSEEWEKQTADCTLIRNGTDRNDIAAKILESRNSSRHAFREELIAGCYAAAAARFLIALLEQNMHYIQMPDETRLKTLFTEAAAADRNGQHEIAENTLRELIGEISQTKDNYYPAQNYFLELILVTKTTAGHPLRKLLQKNMQESRKTTLFMPSALLKQMPEMFPETWETLKTAAAQDAVRFIADDTAAQSLTLMPVLDAADHLSAGLSVYHELLNVSPKVYGKLAAGLSPVLPQLLKAADMKGAVHFAPLDGWKIKGEEQSKIMWQGHDKTPIDALIQYPIDASRYLGFFEFADQFGKIVNGDPVPTSVFALFPGQESVWLESLKRAVSYDAGLGKFMDIEEYFEDSACCGDTVYFGYEKYPVQALNTAETDPVSSWNILYRKNIDRLTQSSVETLLTMLQKPAGTSPAAAQFAEIIGQTAAKSEETHSAGGGFLAVNPFSFPIKINIDGKPTDVPPMGYAYTAKTVKEESPAETETVSRNRTGFNLAGFFAKKIIKQTEPVLARKATDDLGRGEKRRVYLLENRFFSAKFDAVTGVLRSVFTNRSRHNQLSHQIAFRSNQAYSISAADEIVITKSTSDTGQLKITGRLVHADGSLAARYTETATIRSESRLLELELTLEPAAEPDEDRWNSYFAVRYAWNDDTMEMRGGLNDGVHLLPDQTALHSPLFIDLRNEKESLTFFSEGLPFHRRSGHRQLDTLLIVKGETQRKFRFGIGVNSPQVFFAAYEFLLQKKDWVFPMRQAPKNPSSWLFQAESKSAAALYWEPVVENGKPAGVTVYLKNTENRSVHFALRSFLPPKKAAAVNFHGKEIKTLKTDGDAVQIDMHGFELLPVKIDFY